MIAVDASESEAPNCGVTLSYSATMDFCTKLECLLD